MKQIKNDIFNHYYVNQQGNVFNSKNKFRELKSYPNKNTGYMQVVVRNCNKKPKCLYVHRLVAEAYLPNPLNLPEVNHKDMDRSNNSVSNLEWVTTKQNKQHMLLNTKRKNSKILEDNDSVSYTHLTLPTKRIV